MNKTITPPRKSIDRQAVSPYVIYAVALAAILTPMTLMSIHLNGKLEFLKNLSNALFILIPYFWLNPRWRWTLTIPVWSTVIFYFTNILYWRYYTDFIPLSNYFLFQNFGTTTFGAGLSMFKPIDLALFFPAIVFTVIYVLLRKKIVRSKISKGAKLVLTIVSIVLFVTSELSAATGYYRNPWKKSIARYYSINARLTPWVDYNTSGLVTYIIRGLSQDIYLQIRSGRLNDQEIKTVKSFWQIHEMLNKYVKPESANNKGKNLIYIVVESLNSWAVKDEINGHMVMPFLNDVLDSTGTVYSLDMVTQIKSGVSSDGQLMYNTGLYPATDVTTVSSYAYNDFPSLPKSLPGYHSFEVISESAAMWNHSITNKSLGYDFMIDNTRKRAKDENRGQDEVLFETAIEIMDTVPQPFMAFITTISMHGPYKDQNVSRPQWINSVTDKDEQYLDYLTMSNYTDRCIHDFIDGLKEKGLYDNSIIVIASDHSSPVEGIDRDDRIVFVALNTGHTFEVAHPMGQVDIYPTLLDLLGVDADYRGMGLSLFNPKSTAAITNKGTISGQSYPELDSLLNQSYPVANLMHKGNHYSH